MHQWVLTQNDGESDGDFQARTAPIQEKIKSVKKRLGSYNHLPPRGLFQFQINQELKRLIDLLVVKMAVNAPLKVFASMRFPNGMPLPEAFQLQSLLADRGIDLFIVHVAAGDSIHDTVFDNAMSKCVAFVAMGSVTYGQDTGNNASSHMEVLRWDEQYAAEWGPIIPVRLTPGDMPFIHPTGIKVFSNDALALWWGTLSPEMVADEIVFAVSKRIKQHPSIERRATASNVDQMAEKAKAFIWQTTVKEATPTNDVDSATVKEATPTNDVDGASDDPAAQAKKRLKKVRTAMKKLPSKEEQTQEESTKYNKLKKEALRLEAVVQSDGKAINIALVAQGPEEVEKLHTSVAEPEAVATSKRLNKVKKAIKALPPKDERTDEQAAKCKKLKRELVKLQSTLA